MTREQIKLRFTELLTENPPQKDIDYLFQKAVDCGALNITDEPADGYRLAKVIYYAILLKIADEVEPYHPDSRQEAKNLRLFL